MSQGGPYDGFEKVVILVIIVSFAGGAILMALANWLMS